MGGVVNTRCQTWAGQVAVAAALATVLACGGGDGGSGPSGPSGPVVSSTGSVGAIGATITITSSGVNPSQVTVSVGQSVRFVNNDSRSRDMTSDPHPSHTNCPSLNRGVITAGQSRDSLGFGNAGSCGYHDHNDPDNNAFKGRITIQ
jgi:plastocyanin